LGFCETPIVIDMEGNGLAFTNAADGVFFRTDASDQPTKRGWTQAGVDDSWLALDRNGNGMIDDGSELFGAASPQPAPPPGEIGNGFIALAQYDKTDQGGNADGVISHSDAVFSRLLLWRDVNHNGISEASELRAFRDAGDLAFELQYKMSSFRDRHGNLFKYRAKILEGGRHRVGRWAWDVLPVTE
jgi:hypothetical protein